MRALNTALSKNELLASMQCWAEDYGFQQLGVSDVDLSKAEKNLTQWLAKGFHGEMAYMTHHGTKRTRPEELISETARVITVRMDYWPEPSAEPWSVLEDDQLGFISRYALGRDYHKLMRKRLVQLAKKIETEIDEMG